MTCSLDAAGITTVVQWLHDRSRGESFTPVRILYTALQRPVIGIFLISAWLGLAEIIIVWHFVRGCRPRLERTTIAGI